MTDHIKININMDRNCSICGKAGITDSGKCLTCIFTDIKQLVQERVAQEAAGIAPPDSGEPKITSEFIDQCLFANELGDSVLYSALFRNQFLFCNNTQEWFDWRGHFWQRDIMNKTLAAVEKVTEQYLNEYKKTVGQLAGAISAEEPAGTLQKLKSKQSSLLKRVSQLRADKRRTACLKFAHTIENPIAIAGEEFDNKPMLFPCANGVIDLETGRLKPGRPGDYLSLASPVEFTGIETPAPLWEKSLLEIFNGKQEMVDYIQRLLGYSMTGSVKEKVFPLFYGKTGWNGRSLIIETVNHVMGALAGSIPAEMLLSQKYSKSASGPSPDIMSLKGIRLAFASEIDEGQRFSAAKIKWLTGKDELTGRSPHDKYPTRFPPTHKLIVQSNTQPSAPPNDAAFWERLHLISFDISFVNRDPTASYERRAILELDKQVKKEASGILAWLVRGCLFWQQQGLNPPKEVTDATKKYRENEDMLKDFIDECCLVEPGAKEKAAKLYGRFVSWYNANHGKKEPTGSWFGKQLGQKFEKNKSEGCVMYHGIALNSDQGYLGS
jgi:putative DNA primase/helicase